MPRVSIIIPCYNLARFLAEAVESALAQTYRDFEIIIVDDGSTDGSRDVARALIKAHPDAGIRLMEQPNSGVATARNNGIRAAKGEYILPLDADDLLLPNYLERVTRVLDTEPDIDLVYPWSEKFGVESGLDKRGEFTRKVLLMNSGAASNALYRKSAWKKAGGYKPLMKNGYEDWEFSLSLYDAGCKGRPVPEVLFMYRKHGYSRSDDAERNILEITRQIKLLHPKLYEPFLSGISVRLARAVIMLKSWTRDPLMRFIYVRFPGVHARLRAVKYGLMK